LREPIERLQPKLNYHFANTGLLNQALTHRSVGSKNNERLEFLGDAILGFIIADELYKQEKKATEGQLSRFRSSLVKGDMLAEIARDLDLGSYLSLGTGELKSGGQTRSSILADSLEAVFAAVYLDAGYEIARQVIHDLFRKLLADLTNDSQLKDPKTRLQEWLQSRKLCLPQYSIIKVTGEAHAQMFTVKCELVDRGQSVVTQGASRRKAEQSAADQLLKDLMNV